MKFGCQTYTWQMSYEAYSQRLDHIIEVVSQAGFRGIEPEVCMLGSHRNDPQQLVYDLKARSLQMGALCLVHDWLGAEESAAERPETDRIIALLASHFPETVLALCQMPQADRANLAERQQNCIACCNAIGRRAADAGLITVFHPNSPPGSVFRTGDDYRIMIDGLDPEYVGYAPDAGHIAKGGMDPVAIFEQYADRIGHVHFKDMTTSGQWALMGDGSIDFSAIIQVLQNIDYQGWIMVEDESPLAETDPDAATRRNGEWLAVSSM